MQRHRPRNPARKTHRRHVEFTCKALTLFHASLVNWCGRLVWPRWSTNVTRVRLGTGQRSPSSALTTPARGSWGSRRAVWTGGTHTHPIRPLRAHHTGLSSFLEWWPTPCSRRWCGPVDVPTLTMRRHFLDLGVSVEADAGVKAGDRSSLICLITLAVGEPTAESGAPPGGRNRHAAGRELRPRAWIGLRRHH